jgi:hypothetical protein
MIPFSRLIPLGLSTQDQEQLVVATWSFNSQLWQLFAVVLVCRPKFVLPQLESTLNANQQAGNGGSSTLAFIDLRLHRALNGTDCSQPAPTSGHLPKCASFRAFDIRLRFKSALVSETSETLGIGIELAMSAASEVAAK